jgi:hypothetical protein
LNVQNGNDLSKIVDVLDAKMKSDLQKWFLKQELNEYTVLFEENQEVTLQFFFLKFYLFKFIDNKKLKPIFRIRG